MGHRKMVFRPRQSKEKIRSSFEQSLKEKEFEKTVQVAISHYTKPSTGVDFATAILATAEALAIAKDLKWSRSNEECWQFVWHRKGRIKNKRKQTRSV